MDRWTAWAARWFVRDRNLLAFVDDLAGNQRHLADHVLEIRCRHLIYVAIPDGDVGVLADLERSGLLIEEHLVRGPDGVGLERRVDVHGFRHAERSFAVRAGLCLAGD